MHRKNSPGHLLTALLTSIGRPIERRPSRPAAGHRLRLSFAVLAVVTVITTVRTFAEETSLDNLGRFEHAPGTPGIVVAAPHGTADSGTIFLARALAERLGAGVVLVTGFLIPDERATTRINVNRPTEQVRISDRLRILRSPRAEAANARYSMLIKETAGGPLRFFLEIHSNSWPEAAGLVLVGSSRVTTTEALRFKAAYLMAADALPASSGTPRLGIRVAPVDSIRFTFQESSTIADLTEQGFLMELPSVVTRNAEWVAQYADVLGNAVHHYLKDR